MQNSSRILAILSYLLVFVGALFVLLFNREDEFAAFHARQALVLFFTALLGPLVWAVVGWVLLWIPTVGAVVAFALFALVISLFLAILYAWIAGLVSAARAEQRRVPMFGELVRYLPL
ncbi:MAG: DUF4870 domain-containing protein [Caldilineaceae bacterium]|nr:DUF4870 domain-containing protein [Caldilineaceae bacterium]